MAWKPHPGSQTLFLQSPIWETLFAGTRGNGKTDALLMDFAQHVGQGWGPAWRGVLFREEAVQLEDVRAKAHRWFTRIFPRAEYVGAPKDKWVFPDGEELLFRHAKRATDYSKYHGWEIPWIGWEELTNWASPDVYHLLKSINRSTVPGMPRKYRATCNPYGRGHNWVKAYFIDPSPPGVPFVAERTAVARILAEFGVTVESSERLHTVTLHGHYSENEALMAAQPDYPAVIVAAAANPQQAKAWLTDDWDVVAGGMFDDLWDRTRHVLPVFTPPPGWRIDRSFDEGSSKPFSVGWWAEANGEAARLPDGRVFCPPRGSLIRLAEWYGWDGKTPNVGLRMTDAEIGRGIVTREVAMQMRARVRPGPADASIFSAKPGIPTPADAMVSVGAAFVAGDKSPGSRKRRWAIIRGMLAEAAKDRPEAPGLWVTEACRQFLRTVPTLTRSDTDPDDVDTEAEDHIADETGYRVLATKPGTVRFTRLRL